MPSFLGGAAPDPLRLAGRARRRAAHRRRDGPAGRGAPPGRAAARPVGARRPRRSPARPASASSSRSTGRRRPRRRADRHGGGRRRAGGGASRATGCASCATGSPSRTAPSARRPGLAATLRDYQLRGLRLAGPDDLARPRRLPRRRHGPGQDHHADRAAPAPPASRRHRRARRWWSARRRCWATGSARSAGSPPASRCAASTAPAATLDGLRRRVRPHHLRHDALRRRDAWPSSRWGLVVADEAQHVKNPLLRHRQGAAHDPGAPPGSR